MLGTARSENLSHRYSEVSLEDRRTGNGTRYKSPSRTRMSSRRLVEALLGFGVDVDVDVEFLALLRKCSSNGCIRSVYKEWRQVGPFQDNGLLLTLVDPWALVLDLVEPCRDATDPLTLPSENSELRE